MLQAGRTFKYTETGPVGLAGGKTVIVASTRGGAYAGNPALAFLDHQESYLKAVLGFLCQACVTLDQRDLPAALCKAVCAGRAGNAPADDDGNDDQFHKVFT